MDEIVKRSLLNHVREKKEKEEKAEKEKAERDRKLNQKKQYSE